MAEICKRHDAEFRAGAVRIVRETGKPVAQVVRGLGVNEGTLATWISREKAAARAGLDPDERAELARLRKEIHELRMERDVLKRSVVLWVKEATK
ncbi:transposase [Streptomyces sp. NPDC048665]|uniref:transposase n=1 Tax=Streptomyces sp. NPDC048665 TaxID=3155490 RepID=UPI00342B3C52